MAKRVVIDPIPRIEGHLRIEVELENGKVKDAWSSGTLFRGFELILQGRDPRDAWFITQRICGVKVTRIVTRGKAAIGVRIRAARKFVHLAQDKI